MSDLTGRNEPIADDGPPGRPARWRQWLLPAVLLLSLAFNVFLGSALVGRYAHDRSRGDPSLTNFREFADALPASAREKVRESFRARRSALRKERGDLREARSRVMRALSADPYDEAAARLAFEQLRQANNDMSRVAQEAIVDAAGKLSAELRRDLVERRPRGQRSPEDRPRPGGAPPGARP